MNCPSGQLCPVNVFTQPQPNALEMGIWSLPVQCGAKRGSTENSVPSRLSPVPAVYFVSLPQSQAVPFHFVSCPASQAWGRENLESSWIETSPLSPPPFRPGPTEIPVMSPPERRIGTDPVLHAPPSGESPSLTFVRLPLPVTRQPV